MFSEDAQRERERGREWAKEVGWTTQTGGPPTLGHMYYFLCLFRGPGGCDLHRHFADGDHAGGVFYPDWVW